MIGRILIIIVLLFGLILMIGICYNFIKSTRLYNKRKMKLDQWSKFHTQLTEWAKEIVDVDVRVNFINECVSKLSSNRQNLILGGSDRFDKDMLDDWDIDESKKNICDKWGKHIPSLLQEIRDNKLKQIL